MENSFYNNMTYGIYIVSTMDGKRPTGCAVNSAMQISVDPNTIAVSLNKKSYTHKCIDDFGKFAINILAETTNPILIGRFGFFSGKSIDKFEDIAFEMKDELPIPDGICGYATCKVIDKLETSTHTIFLGQVIDARMMSDKRIPMTYKYYKERIK